ncbi:MAG: U32 family peptidase C-terminal domain-containing protein [Candidatus Moranbacteria bacterium]|nr:U32 family peptidase C-terminal domain-containing protein [Candidatus Moranbacteria bacterium]
MKKAPELLAPAGNLEKLKVALEFGADAVYFGLPDFSLRARINQFGKDEIREGARICREKGKKFYVTINIYAHNSHLKELPGHLRFLKEIKPDGVILSDPGVLKMVKKELPEVSLHLSTQANAANSEAVKFWQEQGIERTILARELSLPEISAIKKEVPAMELECFVHGAMCMAYSGRCVLSKWMTGRSANLGDCAQPCRWKYKSSEWRNKNFIDDKDRFELDVEEDKQGTYIFNSYDINLIKYLPELAGAGVDSFKVEGRGKSSYYVGCVVRSYRKVLDALAEKGKETAKEEAGKEYKELEKLSSRGYWTGFITGEEPPHLQEKASLEAPFMYAGLSMERKTSLVREVFVHNFLKKGEKVEVVTPREVFISSVEKIEDEEGNELESAHGGADKYFQVEFSRQIKGVFLLRKIKGAVN